MPTSCTETRSRSPARRTLPSRTAPTPSRSPIARTSAPEARNWNEEVREATRTPRMRARAAISSSARPSQKYSWSRAGLRSANGRTAIEGAFVSSGDAACGAEPTASSAKSSSRAVGKRSSGRLARHRRDDALDARGQRPARERRGRLVPQDGGLGLGDRPPGERALSGQHLVEQDAEGEEVGAVVHGKPAHLLGRHVADRAQHDVGRGPFAASGGT